MNPSAAISVTPVIQALNRLEASGFVSYVPNKGYFVNEITVEEAFQLYEARQALETYVIPQVVENITPKAIENLRAKFKSQSLASPLPPNRSFILIDAQFHLDLAEFAGNEVISKLLSEIFEKLFLRYPPHYMDSARVKEISREHRTILDALSQGDAQTAIQVTQEHIVQGRDRFISSLRSQQDATLSLP